MRYLRILVGLMILSHNHLALAIQTTALELNELKQAFEQQTLNMVFYESQGRLDKYLSELSANQSIWLKQQWLSRLATLTHPSAEQQAWLEKQIVSQEALTIANPDHPTQLLSVINIAQQAKTSQQHWEINQQVRLFEKRWGTHEWRWQDVISPKNILVQKAFKQWISGAEETVAGQVARGYLTLLEGPMQSDNRLLALLAEYSKSGELYAHLWQNNADEYTYQALAKLPAVFEESAVIEQVVKANTNRKLQSQALFLLAERYSHDRKAQQTLLAALDDPEAKWLTAAVLNKISDQDFLADLNRKLIQQKPSGFRALALKKLRQAAEHEVLR